MADTKASSPARTWGSEAYKRYRASEKYRRTYTNSHLIRKYGITLDEYERLLREQGGVCKICALVDDRAWRDGRKQRLPLCVDHCHKTGRVRGLLCNKCNVAIALMKESAANLAKAIEYLNGALN